MCVWKLLHTFSTILTAQSSNSTEKRERQTDRQNQRKVSVIKPHKLHIRDIPVE